MTDQEHRETAAGEEAASMKRMIDQVAETFRKQLDTAGIAIVPVEPPAGLLVSMAICLDHGFGLPAQMLGGVPIGQSAERKQAMLSDMRKLYDEVVGRGYWKPEREAQYLAWAPPAGPVELGCQPLIEMGRTMAAHYAVTHPETFPPLLMTDVPADSAWQPPVTEPPAAAAELTQSQSDLMNATKEKLERGEIGSWKLPSLSEIDALRERQAEGTFQAKVQQWMLACFGEQIATSHRERNFRFLEEAIELVQACDATAEECHALVNYVFERPVGEKGQEVGGVMVTLAALCSSQGLDMADAAESELDRVWTKVEQIRAKQAAKRLRDPVGPLP